MIKWPNPIFRCFGLICSLSDFCCYYLSVFAIVLRLQFDCQWYSVGQNAMLCILRMLLLFQFLRSLNKIIAWKFINAYFIIILQIALLMFLHLPLCYLISIFSYLKLNKRMTKVCHFSFIQLLKNNRGRSSPLVT